MENAQRQINTGKRPRKLDYLMPKSRAEDNKRLRQRRKDAGLVHYRVWVTESEKRALEDALRFMRIIKEK